MIAASGGKKVLVLGKREKIQKRPKNKRPIVAGTKPVEDRRGSVEGKGGRIEEN